jgi:hypothetical protein
MKDKSGHATSVPFPLLPFELESSIHTFSPSFFGDLIRTDESFGGKADWISLNNLLLLATLYDRPAGQVSRMDSALKSGDCRSGLQTGSF